MIATINLALPASALAKDIDDMTQAFGALLPVILQASLHCIWVSRNNAFNDALMFLHGGMEVLDNGARIQPPIALRLWFDGIVQCR